MATEYSVRVDRVGYGDITLIVQANNRIEAESAAIQSAKDAVMMETSSAYDVTTVRELPVEKNYHVTWETDIEASSPEVAAEMALAIHRDAYSMATIFTVTCDGGPEQLIDADIDPAYNKWPVEDWQYYVANGDTKLGYLEWVQHNEESNS